MSRTLGVLISFGALAISCDAVAQLTVRSGTATTAANLTTIVDTYRLDLSAGPFAGPRREANWDGVPASFAAPNLLPNDLYNTLAPRGLVLASVAPGTGFQVSGSAGDVGPGQPVAVSFGHINANYPFQFQFFSAFRMLAPLGNHQFDVLFFEPGTNKPALTRGFGAVFEDVDVAGATSLQFFDAQGQSLATLAVPVANVALSFLGASTADGRATIARVRVVLGNTAIGPNDNNGSSDVVVMDDFIYGEPISPLLFRDGFE